LVIAENYSLGRILEIELGFVRCIQYEEKIRVYTHSQRTV